MEAVKNEAETIDSASTETTVQNNKVVSLPDPTQDPMEVAAMLFTLYLPKFELMVDKLSNNSLRRILRALIKVPLVDANLNSVNEVEKTTFAIAERLLEAKWLMIQHSLYEHNQEIQNALTEPTVENPSDVQTELNSINEGEKNGT